MKVLTIDAHNQMHRARSGFTAGEFAVVYNFFRGLRASVEEHGPNRAYFVLEGHPKANHELLGEYKANRVAEEGSERHAAMQDFHRQKRIIVDLMQKYFPVSCVRHPDFEADDTIANLIRTGSRSVEWTVLSSDTDFIQLLQRYPNVRIYNPIRKVQMTSPEYSYVEWKALRGDATDNIPGIPGVGDKTAEKIVSDPKRLAEFVSRDDVAELYERNLKVIQFADWNEEEMMGMTSSSPVRDWETVKAEFDRMGFSSITKDKTWDKFVATFDKLWSV